VGAQSLSVVADHVILTLPFAVLRSLDTSRAGFDALKQQAIRELGRGRNGKLMTQFSQRLWNTSGRWGVSTGGTYTDLPYQSGWDVSRARPGASGTLVASPGGSGPDQYSQSAPYTTAADSRTLASARETVRELDQVFPGLAPLFNGRANLSLPFQDANL